MAEIKIPLFESGCVLTREMLEMLKHYPMEFSELSLKDYSDGIVSGCRVSMTGNVVSVESGMIKHMGRLLFIPEGMKAVVLPGNEWHILQFVVGESRREGNFLVCNAQLEITADLQDQGNIEVCRFRLQGGAQLRNVYQDYNDLNTEFDTVNEIYAKWSGYRKETVSVRVLEEFAKEAMKKGVQNPQDLAMIQQILALGGRSINRESLQFYLATRLNRPYAEMTNLEIYKGFGEVLRNLQTAVPKGPGRGREERRIIVD